MRFFHSILHISIDFAHPNNWRYLTLIVAANLVTYYVFVASTSQKLQAC